MILCVQSKIENFDPPPQVFVFKAFHNDHAVIAKASGGTACASVIELDDIAILLNTSSRVVMSGWEY